MARRRSSFVARVAVPVIVVCSVTACGDDGPAAAPPASGPEGAGSAPTTGGEDLSAVTTEAVATSAPTVDEVLRAELLEMAERDQAVRLAVPPEGDESAFDDLMAEWDRVDAENARRMDEILAEYGWPGWSLVGEDGATAAWLLVQHADLYPELQSRGLELLEAAVDAGDASAGDLAYLTDRVRVADGEPQVYGTQWEISIDGELTPRTPIEDEAGVDARRAAAGLGTLAEYREELRAAWGG